MVCWRSDYEKSSIREIHWTDIGFHFEEALLLTRFVFHFDHVPQPVIFHLVHSHVKITTPIWLKWRYNKRQSNEYETRCSYEKSIEIGAFQGKRRALKELLVIYKRPTILVTWPCNTLISPSRKVIIGSDRPSYFYSPTKNIWFPWSTSCYLAFESSRWAREWGRDPKITVNH